MSGSQQRGAWSKPLIRASGSAPPKAPAPAPAPTFQSPIQTVKTNAKSKVPEAKRAVIKQALAKEGIPPHFHPTSAPPSSGNAWKKPLTASASSGAVSVAAPGVVMAPTLKRTPSAGKSSARFQIGEQGNGPIVTPTDDWVLCS
jgi:hypothetical protein